MAHYLLDTNTLSYLYDSKSPHSFEVASHLELVGDDESVSISVLNLYELHHGASYKETFPILPKMVEEDFEILPIPVSAGAVFGKLKRMYQTKTGIGKRELERHNIDFILAVTAMSNSMILVSNDSIFTKLSELEPELKIENWI